MKYAVRLLTTFFHIGDIPLAPGTFGSAAGLLIAWQFNPWLPVLTIALTALGLILCRPAVELYGTKDPGCFVLDEVCGMMLALVTVPVTPLHYAAGFALFRMFDVWKPWPISRLDRSGHALAIMGDDLAAGLAANAALQVLVRIAG